MITISNIHKIKQLLKFHLMPRKLEKGRLLKTKGLLGYPSIPGF